MEDDCRTPSLVLTNLNLHPSNQSPLEALSHWLGRHSCSLSGCCVCISWSINTRHHHRRCVPSFPCSRFGLSLLCVHVGCWWHLMCEAQAKPAINRICGCADVATLAIMTVVHGNPISVKLSNTTERSNPHAIINSSSPLLVVRRVLY